MKNLVLTMFAIFVSIMACTGQQSVSVDSAIPAADVIPITELKPASDNQATPAIVQIEDDEYLLKDGKAYHVETLVENSTIPQQSTYAKIKEEEMETLSIAICFIVPCLTIIIVLVVFLIFFLKKAKLKNAIIEKAIDANYQLPDSFFMPQRPQLIEALYPSGTTTVESQQPNQAPHKHESHKLSLTDPACRDSRKFSSGVTLIAVGIASIAFAGCINGPFFIVAGIIPAIIGIGRLFGYFFIPGYTSDRQFNYNATSRTRQPYQHFHQYQEDPDIQKRQQPTPPPYRSQQPSGSYDNPDDTPSEQLSRQ